MGATRANGSAFDGEVNYLDYPDGLNTITGVINGRDTPRDSISRNTQPAFPGFENGRAMSQGTRAASSVWGLQRRAQPC